MYFLFLTLLTVVQAQWLLLEEAGPEILGTEPNARPKAYVDACFWCYSDDLFLFSAQDAHVWKYETEDRRWVWQPNGPFTFPLTTTEHHKLPHWSLNGYLWVLHTNGQIWRYEPEMRMWSAITLSVSSQNKPSFYLGAAFWTHQLSTKLYLYGSPSANSTAELWAFDADTLIWVNIPYINNPGTSNVQFAVAVLGKSEDTVYLFGGTVDMMHELDLATKTWTLSPVQSGSSSIAGPPVRTHHVMWHTPEQDRIAVYGGKEGAKVLKDFWYYDVEQQLWTQDERGGGPEARYGSSWCLDKSGYMFMYGGYPHYNDVWKNGPLTAGNIFQLIEFKLDTATLSAMLAGAMSTILVVALFIGLLCLCIIRCRKRKAQFRASAATPPFGTNEAF